VLKADIDINVIVSARYFGDIISEQLLGYNNPCMKWITIEEIIDKGICI
jgi:hypothetical protein